MIERELSEMLISVFQVLKEALFFIPVAVL